MQCKHKIISGGFLFLAGYLFLYTLISGSFLTVFPFVHSDEVWLAGLTRDMQSGGFGTTESFFDLKPRIPHAIKILFHVIQMVYIRLFGFDIQSVRLLSLTAGLICLVLVFLIGKELGGRYCGFGLMILVSLDTQFIYASHFARQEIILTISLLACILILVRCGGRPDTGQTLALAVVTGLSVGIHPNSFLCAAVCGAVIAACGCFKQSKPLHRTLVPLCLYTAVTGAIAAVFIGLSFLFCPTFIPDYFRYGEQEFELSRTASGRMSEFLYYLKSIYARESGTYYLPDQRLLLTLTGLALILVLLAFLFLLSSKEEEIRIWCRHTRVLLSVICGLAAGMLIIGRYNQTSIIFLLLTGWFLLLQLCLLFERGGRLAAFAAAAAFLLWSGHAQISPYLSAQPYASYLEQIGELVPADAKTIANLNSGFAFDQGKLLDYRNLPYLDDIKDLDDYVRQNQIEYICITDELDYIYDNRPYYNVIYGNAAFIQDLKTYCEQNGSLIGRFESPLYSPRIISLINDPAWAGVSVYQISPDSTSAVP